MWHTFKTKAFNTALTAVSCCILLAGCNSPKTNPSTEKKGAAVDTNKISTVEERYSTGVIKSRTQAKGNRREGLTQNYNENGQLTTEIMYKNNMKEGMARTFYPNGKVSMEVPYVKGLQDGNAKWFYETGEAYRVTPYVQGKRQGMQKLYYKDGKIKAEIPFKDDAQIPGMKEYLMNGTQIPEPTMQIRRGTQGNTSVLVIGLSDKSKEVTYYEGALADWKFFPQAMNKLPKNANGEGILTISNRIMSQGKAHIIAVEKTDMGNDLILEKTYKL